MITQNQLDARDIYIEALENQIKRIESNMLVSFECTKNNGRYVKGIADADIIAQVMK